MNEQMCIVLSLPDWSTVVSWFLCWMIVGTLVVTYLLIEDCILDSDQHKTLYNDTLVDMWVLRPVAWVVLGLIWPYVLWDLKWKF